MNRPFPNQWTKSLCPSITKKDRGTRPYDTQLATSTRHNGESEATKHKLLWTLTGCFSSVNCVPDMLKRFNGHSRNKGETFKGPLRGIKSYSLFFESPLRFHKSSENVPTRRILLAHLYSSMEQQVSSLTSVWGTHGITSSFPLSLSGPWTTCRRPSLEPSLQRQGN